MFIPDLSVENVLLLNVGSDLQLGDLHLVTWSIGPTTSVAIIKHGHSGDPDDSQCERNMTMLAYGTSSMSVHKIEDAVLHMLNMLQQRLGMFSEALETMQQSMGCARWVYQPEHAILRRDQVMPIPFVSIRERSRRFTC